MIEVGKAMKNLLKDFINQLPEVRARENNFGRLYRKLSKSIYRYW